MDTLREPLRSSLDPSPLPTHAPMQAGRPATQPRPGQRRRRPGPARAAEQRLDATPAAQWPALVGAQRPL